MAVRMTSFLWHVVLWNWKCPEVKWNHKSTTSVNSLTQSMTVIMFQSESEMTHLIDQSHHGIAPCGMVELLLNWTELHGLISHAFKLELEELCTTCSSQPGWRSCPAVKCNHKSTTVLSIHWLSIQSESEITNTVTHQISQNHHIIATYGLTLSVCWFELNWNYCSCYV